MAEEKPWRPADYPSLAVYVPQETVYMPPLIVENWGFSPQRELAGALHTLARPGSDKRSSRGLTSTAWYILAWAITCGLVAAIVAIILAVFVLHLT
jgi:hypothetical protein